MITELVKLNRKQIEATNDNQVKMRLSEDAASMVFQLFTKSVYSNPIGTIVREITSNCFDSHVEAGVNDPVLIKKTVDPQTDTIYISFIDYGVGISPERMKDVYGVYFESTKRSTNEQIGGWGIGAKSVLAYKRYYGDGAIEYDNSFYVITNFDGIKYSYCIYEGNDSPIVNLLHSEPTTERNGTEVSIPVLNKDYRTFTKEMVKQLYYFENIIFEGFEETEVTNDYQIIKGKTFLYRGSNVSEFMHVCLGKVAYPIDYSILGLDKYLYQIPVAIQINIGEINVTVSREAIDYSEQTIKLLKKKLDEVIDELTQMLIRQYENTVTLEDYFKMSHKYGTLYLSDNESINLNKIIDKTKIDFSNFKYNFMKMPTDSQLFNLFFNIRLFGKRETRYERRNYEGNRVFTGSYEQLINKPINVLYVNNKFDRKIINQAYLKSEFERYYIITKKQIGKWSVPDIIDIFKTMDSIAKLDEKDGSLIFTDFGKSILAMQDEYFDIVRKNINNYDDLIVPEDFIAKRKRKSVSINVNEYITINTPKMTRTQVRIKTLMDLNFSIFYGSRDDDHKLENAYSYIDDIHNPDLSIRRSWNFDAHLSEIKSGILFITISKNNFKYMNFCKHAHHIDEFGWRIVNRKRDAIVESFANYKLVERFQDLSPLYKNPLFKKVSTKWGNKILKVSSYITKVKNLYNRNWIASQYKITPYINLNNVEISKEHESIVNDIKALEALQKTNEKYINHIYLGDIDRDYDTFWEILQKIMIL